MEILLIIVLVISCLSLLTSLIMIILFVKNKKEVGNSSVNENTIKESINNNLKDIQLELNKEILNINNQINDKLNAQNEKLAEIKDSNLSAITNNNAKILELVTQQLGEIRKTVDSKLNDGFKNNSENLEKVNLALGKISKAQENIDSLSKEVSSLNNVLNNTQARGKFGEVSLNAILSQVFGETHKLFSTQYSINKGSSGNVRPDAVVFLPEPDNLLCIDSKFPFVNYQDLILNNKNDKENISNFKKELKSQIDKISSAYIIKNKTCAYAIMYIPNDSILGYIQVNDELYVSVIEYARMKNVILCSPSTLQAILSNVLTLRLNYEIANNVNNIVVEVNKLKELSKTLSIRWEALAKNINALQSKKDDMDTSVRRINSKTEKIVEIAINKNLISEEELNSNID